MTKQECLKALRQCLAACNTCYTEGLKEKDINHMREWIKTDRQCAMIVSLTMKTIELEGSFVKETCELCAMVCDQCAKEGEKHDPLHCKECAQACKVCAAACRELVA
jgi:hypothetical protein